MTVAGLPAGNPAVELGLGALFSCARLTDGAVWCWGDNYLGQCGSGSIGGSQPAPDPVAGVTGAVQLSVGGTSACVRLASGAVQCWGDSQWGQIAQDTAVSFASPVDVPGFRDALEVRVGGGHTCARLAGGVVQCAGSGLDGELGTALRPDYPVPARVTGAP